MSRIIVKNLPKHLNEDRFKEHFSTQGEVTDVKLIRTAQGQSRRFGYVGFRTEKEAKAAVRHFNNTFIDTSKIVVEKALPYGDASLPRPWSHHSVGSTGYFQKTGIRPEEAQKSIDEKKKKRQEEFEKEMKKKQEHIQSVYKEFENDKLKEFLEVMQPKTKTRTWANDDVKPETELPKVKTNVTAVKSKKAGGEGILLTKTHVKFEDSEDELYEDMPSKPTKDEDDEEMDTNTEEPEGKLANDTSVSDLDWLKSRMTMKPESDAESDSSNSDSEDEASDADGSEATASEPESSEPKETAPEPEKEKEAPATKPSDLPPARPFEVPPAELIADTGRLFLRNLPYTCTEDDLKKLFNKFGPLSEIHMPIDKETKKPKGFAYILYLIPEHAVKAFFELDGKFFQGRLLHILPAKEKPQPPKEDESNMSIKKQKEAKRKAQSGNDFNWNSLFMSSDAIADSIADRLNVAKSDILNPDADNLAVRMAMAETHIITETKDYLEEHGICLDAFAKKERSDTVILVKNIPYGTAEEEFRELFGKHGSLGRVLIPPAKTIAVVEFLEPSEARAAFRHLAYKRFKNSLIYLEKAPVGVFKSEYDPNAKPEHKKAASSSTTIEEITKADDEEDLDTATLFVKNLNFNTTEESLRKTFEGIEGMRAVRIKTKPDPKNPSKKLSMGFGFVEFTSKDTAQTALKALQGVMLDEHTLQLKLSDKKSIQEPTGHRKSTSSKKEGTKLLVKNIAFEATKKDLQQLFSNYGQLKSVRLPKKFSGGHRGFAFVEFLTKQEAKNVMNNLASTHLYGRHLVIEYAEEEKSIEEMRAKTEREYSKEEAMNPNKKQRIMMPGEEEDMEF
ncbi:RNA-binding domain-containing protein [Basidiobolus meristosporus CBS 931.73]|uniref:RNA-binding domain-containing protein n=1 Tax=Basidiobolus meristosporus CBS 931.73 TaxID=1314790 RepID=A0A1Y1YJW7_9FUNG|nr:RNA-binding domain-containing protein [Basidiobolus meristosporus CBS 931.73]|eukprot:ORX98262.1 RNA-binding domain-containing protein [Basidiobolus meristosporus CBS 931.73]